MILSRKLIYQAVQKYRKREANCMKYIEYREKREHGTKGFPCACYHVTPNFPRYNMIHHWHNECEIIYVRKGCFELILDGKNIQLEQGCCSVIIGGSMHGGTPKAGCCYDCLLFDIGLLLRGSSSCLSAIQPVINHDKKLTPVFPAESEISRLAYEVIELMLKKSDGYEFFVQSGIMRLMGIISSDESCYDSIDMTSTNLKKIIKFKQVLSYIEQHYREQITLEELANQCGMNRNYFCRAFKEYTHKTPVEYLNYYRIESACEKIVSTDENLIDIAMSCGFNDYSYFIKVFKSQKGVTPGSYSRRSF